MGMAVATTIGVKDGNGIGAGPMRRGVGLGLTVGLGVGVSTMAVGAGIVAVGIGTGVDVAGGVGTTVGAAAGVAGSQAMRRKHKVVRSKRLNKGSPLPDGSGYLPQLPSPRRPKGDTTPQSKCYVELATG